MITKVYENAIPPVESFKLGEDDDDVYLNVIIDSTDDSIFIEPLQGSFWVWLKNDRPHGHMTIDELIEGLTDLKKTLESK